MKGKMKVRLFAVLMAIVMLAMVFPNAANAASYPTIVLDNDYKNMKIVTGTSEKLIFYINREYSQEEYYVNIYKGSGTNEKNLIGVAHQSLANKEDNLILTITINTKQLEMSVGTYTIECFMTYYNGGKWNRGPVATSPLYVVKNTCGSNHKYGSGKVTEAASCIYEGRRVYTCSVCGVKKMETIPFTDHSYGAGKVQTAATCTREGVRIYTCKVCGVIKTEAIPKINHIYGEGEVGIPPTCTKDGEMLYFCIACGKSKAEVIPKTHTWDEGTIVTPPTVAWEGLKDVTCLVCGIPGQLEVPRIFSDMYNDWFTAYVQYVYDNGLMTGIKGTTLFQPNANITKAQVAQVLYNVEEQPEVINRHVFEELQDVHSAEWYADAVAWAYDTGVVTGDLNTKKFSPNADVTREQLALMMYRYAAYKMYDTDQREDLAGLKNEENVSNWARTAVEWSVGAGLISGIDNNGVKDLAPQGNASRAQVAAILQRFIEGIVNAPIPTPTPEVTITPEVTVTPGVIESAGRDEILFVPEITEEVQVTEAQKV